MGQQKIMVERLARQGGPKTSLIEVVPAKTTGRFTRLLPDYRRNYKALLGEITELYDKNVEAERPRYARDLLRLSLSSKEHERMVKSHRIFLRTEREKILRRLHTFSVDTLIGVLELAKTGQFSVISVHCESEQLMRESIAFRNILHGTIVGHEKFALADVRESLPKFALEDLSVLRGDDRRHADEVLTVSLQLRKMRVGRFLKETKHLKNTDEFLHLRMSYVVQSSYMEPELAELIGTFPGRSDDITAYFQAHDSDDAPVSIGHLRKCLENPTRALMDGVL